MNSEFSTTAPTRDVASPGSAPRLRQRRQILAQPLQDDDTQDSLEIVVFYLGHGSQSDERKESHETAISAPNAASVESFGHYAFETAQVREVFPVTDASQIAMLPGTPPWVRGILNVRGHILAVLDLQRLFGLPEQEIVGAAPVLILRSEVITDAASIERTGAKEGIVAAGDVALATNGVAGVRLLPRAQLETSHALEGTPGARYLRGVTPDGIALLDATLLLSDMQLVVQAE